MVTAKSDASDVVELLSLGANDYIVKPIDFEIAVMRIMTHIKIGTLFREMGRLKQVEAINAIITTYNHEINNPLSIAFGCLKLCLKKNDTESLEKLESSLWRIASIVRKIQETTFTDEIKFENYSKNTKMIKIK
jgi:DNA-binding response OmpR family regulator